MIVDIEGDAMDPTEQNWIQGEVSHVSELVELLSKRIHAHNVHKRIPGWLVSTFTDLDFVFLTQPTL